jgi:hypothetical protein
VNRAWEGSWGTYAIKEEGKNGTVEILEDRIVRTRKKLIGKR